jgi:GDPmannose 4,6-dehydratase
VAIQQAQPDEIYHLAAQSHVTESEVDSDGTMKVNVQGTENLLQCAQSEVPGTRFFFASSCQVFGDAAEVPQNETTLFNPVNPYGVSKMEATMNVRKAREEGLFAVNGFLYNHESPRRGANFVTQKICRGVAAISAGKEEELRLGDTTMERDWTDARDIVRGMWCLPILILLLSQLKLPRPRGKFFASQSWHHDEGIHDCRETHSPRIDLPHGLYVHSLSPPFWRLHMG